MKIIYNDFIPFKGFKAINLFGILFVRNGTGLVNKVDLNHERIHTRQLIECTLIVLAIVIGAIALGASWWWLLLVIPSYYLLYLVAWAVAGFRYRAICFEREAYNHQSDLGYLSRRKPFTWMTYVRKSK